MVDDRGIEALRSPQAVSVLVAAAKSQTGLTVRERRSSVTVLASADTMQPSPQKLDHRENVP